MLNKNLNSSHQTVLKNYKPISKKSEKHIGLVIGGLSSEREISLSSGKLILKSLLELGYEVTTFDMGQDIEPKLSSVKPDIVFNCLHGSYGENGCLQGLLNILQIPYTNSGVLASSICMNKLATKIYLRSIDKLNLPPAEIITKDKNDLQCTNQHINKVQNISQDSEFYLKSNDKCVIKPINHGSSIGVHILPSRSDFKIEEYEFKYGNILIEKFIEGRELQIAVLNGVTLGIMELKFLKSQIYDYETKYTAGLASHILPANIDQDHYQHLSKLSEEIYKILGCKGLIRIEFIYSDQENKSYFLEVNTHPGMTSTSICSEIAQYYGINFNNLVDKLLLCASYE